jgi:hypothetical protein
MEGTWFVVLEAHAAGATLYLHGELGAREAENAVSLCAALPPGVERLRIDARGVPRDDDTLRTIVHTLTQLWALTRDEGRGARAGERRASSVTVSLHDRAEAVTRPGQHPGDSSEPAARTPSALTPPSSIPGPICASSQ